MESVQTNGGTVRLPQGMPEEIQLLNQSWLADQQAGGARLTLEPGELNRMSGAPAALRAEPSRAETERSQAEAERDALGAELDVLRSRFSTEQRANQAMLATVVELERRGMERGKILRSLDCQLSGVQDEVRELHRALDHAERPLWRRLLRR